MKRIFPLDENYFVHPQISNVNALENCAIVGESSILKTSLLFQAAVSIASAGDQVLYICNDPPQQLPYPVVGMLEPTPLVLECIKMVYIIDPPDLLKYLCEFHTKGCLPAAIIVNDIEYYVSHLNHDESREDALVKIFALLEDTTAFILNKKGDTCHRFISMSSNSCPKTYTKRYFKEWWNLSRGMERNEYFLTDGSIPAHRIQFSEDKDQKLRLHRIYRLPMEFAAR